MVYMLFELNITRDILVIALLIGVAVITIFKIPKIILKLITNSIVGIIAILALTYVFNVGIPLKTYVLIATALFGLPAVVIFSLLKVFGVAF